jgi:hypothetical protein
MRRPPSSGAGTSPLRPVFDQTEYFLEVCRLRAMVIKSRFARTRLVLGLAPSGDGQKQHIGPPGLPTYFACDFMPGHTRHSDVQNRRMRLEYHRGFARTLAVVLHAYRVPSRREERIPGSS